MLEGVQRLLQIFKNDPNTGRPQGDLIQFSFQCGFSGVPPPQMGSMFKMEQQAGGPPYGSGDFPPEKRVRR